MELDIKIYLYDILINGQSSSDLSGLLDLKEKDFNDLGLEFVYNIEDIANSGERKTSYSKSFKLPDTPNNNNIFKNVFNLNILDGSFNPNKKQKCLIAINNKIIVSGFLKLRSIDQVYANGKLVNEYSVNIYDEVKDLFVDLGNKSLKDLDFNTPYSYMGVNYDFSDHYYGAYNIYESQTRAKSYTNVYDYCLINWHQQGESNGDNWPAKSYNSGTYYLPPDQFYPSIYVKAILDRILSSVGYTYESKFLSGTSYDGLFGKLVTIYNGGKMLSPLTDYYQTKNIATQPGDNDYSGTDPDDNFEINRLSSYLDWECDAVDRGHFISEFNVIGSGEYQFEFEMVNLVDNSTPGEYGSTFILSNRAGDVLYEYPMSQMTNTDNSYITGELTSKFGTTLNLTKGDILEPNLKVGFVDNDPNYTGATFQVENFAMNIKIVHEGVEERTNTVVSVDEFLPGITQSDFIKGLIKQFNLYIYPDKLDSKKLIIEPRPDFFRDGKVLDWTHKVDRTELSSKPTNKKISKTYEYNQSEVDSIKTRAFYNTNAIELGNKIVTYDNTDLSGTDKVESGFGGYHVNTIQDTSNNVYYPNFTNTTFDSLTTEKRETSPLIGILDNVDVSPKTIKVRGVSSIIQNWNTVSNIGIVGNTKYDINFNKYQQIEGEDSQDMFDLFWADSLSNLHNINQRLIEKRVNLDVLDFLNLDFRNIVMIDGMPYIVQKVVADFTRTTQSKVELIKAYDIDLNLYENKINFYYANIPVGDIESGANKPVLDYNLFNSNRYVKKVDPTSKSVQFVPNSTSVDYLWFAMPTSADYSLATDWAINNVNRGNIGGGGNLFGTKQVINYQGQDYNTYLANYQTFIDSDLTITFNKDFTIAYDFRFGQTGDLPGEFRIPLGIEVANDRIYVIDAGKQLWYDTVSVPPMACQIFDMDGNYISEFGYRWDAPNVPPYDPSNGEFVSPISIAANSSNIYIGDATRYDIQILDLNGNYLSKFGSEGQEAGEFLTLYGISLNSTKLYAIADSRFISMHQLDGTYINRFGGDGSGDGQFRQPFAIASDDNFVYVGDDTRLDVQVFDTNGNYIAKFGSPGSGGGEFLSVRGIDIDDNYIFVLDQTKKSIEIFSRTDYSYVSRYVADGTAPGEFSDPIAIDVFSGQIKIVDRTNDNVTSFSY